MNYIVNAHTDVGLTKQTNQDCLCIKVANTNQGLMLLAVLCDGMGGLSKGELASATVVREFITWFERTLPTQLDQPLNMENIKSQWSQMVQSLNIRIADYASKNRFTMGTTLSAIFMANQQYLIVHVGDSRIYHLKTEIRQLTTDHTVVAREISAGRLTVEQAKRDPRKNVLVQCVGASRIVSPEFTSGKIEKGEAYLLCCDGFRHEITEKELFRYLTPSQMNSEPDIKKALVQLVEMNKARKETDNISAAYIKLA